MLTINNLGIVYEIYNPDEDISYSISQVGNDVFLYSSFGDQIFTYNGDMNKSELQAAFPDRKAAVHASQLHTRGILNKTRFKESVSKLKMEEQITAENFEHLIKFIESCNCAPAKVLVKLIQQGFSNIISKLDFYEESQVMIDTTQAFINFIEEFL